MIPCTCTILVLVVMSDIVTLVLHGRHLWNSGHDFKDDGNECAVVVVVVLVVLVVVELGSNW